MIKENNCQSKTLSKRGLTEYGGKLWMAGVLGNNTEIFAMWSKWQQRLDLMGGEAVSAFTVSIDPRSPICPKALATGGPPEPAFWA